MDPKTRIEWAELALKFIALLASGIWAFWLLFVLRKRELARADLQKKEAEIRDLELKEKLQSADYELRARQADAQIRELELKAKRQAAVSVEINPTVLRNPNDDGHLILANVELTNRGDRNTRICWENEPPALTMRFVKNVGNAGPEYDEPKFFRVMQVRDPNNPAISHVVRAGATERLAFLLQAALPGLYLLSFRGALDKQERAESEALGAILPVSWTSKKYVLVPEAEANSPAE